MGRNNTETGVASAIMAGCGMPGAAGARPLRSALMALAAQAFLAEFRAWRESPDQSQRLSEKLGSYGRSLSCN